MPAEHGAADVDQLHEQRGRAFDLRQLEQVTAGVNVMDDRLVHVTLGFTADNAEIVVLDYGVTIGDPTSDEPWVELAARLARPVGPGLPVSIVGCDAGFHTSEVRKQCGPPLRRSHWPRLPFRARHLRLGQSCE